MKKAILLLILFSCVLIGCKRKDKLVGEWSSKGQYEENEILIFKEDGTLLSVKKENGESNFPFKSGKVKYRLNTSKTPNEIDYIFYDIDSNEELFRLRGIIDFLGESTARIGFNTNKRDMIETLSRPKSFDDCDIKMLTKVSK